MHWNQVKMFLLHGCISQMFPSLTTEKALVIDVSATMFPSLAKSMEHRLAIFRAHIRCHASLHKNLNGMRNELTFEKKCSLC